MRKLTKRFGLLLVTLLLIGPFFVPVNTSGTLSKEDANKSVWGDQSKWIELAGHEVHYVTAGDPESKRFLDWKPRESQ